MKSSSWAVVRFGSMLLALIAAPACSGGSAPDTSAEGGVASVEQDVTAQPDPSCKYARLGVHDYWICSVTKNFSAAKTTCEGVGMHLVRIDNAAENDFVKGQIGADSWIGATDSAVEKTWRWVNDNAQFWNGNRPGSPVGGLYNQWTSTEPNDLLGEDCGVMIKGPGEWNDVPCSVSRAFVCESQPATANQPQAPDTACTRTTRNGSTYWTCSNARSWDTARANCQSIGTELATIDDAAEGTFLAPSFTRDTHIGLNDRDEEGTWRWSSNRRPSFCGTSSGRTAYGSYSNWNSGQPIRSNTCQKVESSTRAYWVCTNEATWDAAKDECAGSGMSLARVDDAAENALIAGKVTLDTWLGGSDRAAETQWRWVDNTQFWSGTDTGSRVGGRYANFTPGEPNDLFDEDCLLMHPGGQWNDSWCTADLGGIGFACEGPKTAGYPDRNDCAFASSAGKWSAGACNVARAYVCESIPAGANATMEDLAANIRENHTLGAPRVMGFEMKPNMQVKEPFIGREERLGLRGCSDSLEPTGTPEIVRSTGLERVTYAQLYEGIPVFGRGYSVMRDPTTKFVSSALGEVAPRLTSTTTPVVTQSQALSKAVAAIGRQLSSYSPTPAGILMILPKKQGRDPQWELGWLFSLRSSAADDGATVGISAITGNVILRSRQSRACVTGPLPSPYVQQPVAVNAFQSTLRTDPSQALMSLSTSGTMYLYSQGTTLNSASPLFGKPEITTVCGSASLPSIMQVPPPSPIQYQLGNAFPTDEGTGASMFLATQTSLNAFASLFQTRTGTPWIGIDGTGIKRVPLHIGAGGSEFRPGTGVVHFEVETAYPLQGAALDVASHELAHGVFNEFLPYTGNRADLEMLAVSEGFADVVAGIVEAAVRLPNSNLTGQYCFMGDGAQDQLCVRDHQQPLASTQSGCVAQDASGNVTRWGCPSDYNGPDYCTSNVDCRATNVQPCCDEHTNATVLDHWHYLITAGDTAVSQSTCAYKVQPLAADPLTAARTAGQIVFNAVRDKEWSNLQYPQFAEATIKAAERLYGANSAQVKTVVAGWYAANVREDITASPTVYPPRGAKKVNPWMTFIWRVATGETAWDFQLDNNDFAGSKVLFEKRNVTTTQGTPLSAYLSLALPENTLSHYVWRVRPHSNDPWSDCYAVHWFDDTGPTVQPTVSLGTLNAQGQLQPGTGYVYFPQLPLLTDGIGGYNVQLSQQNVACVDTVGVPRVVEPAITSNVEETGVHAVRFLGIQPQGTYYAHVQALGPPSISDGKRAVGPCVTVTVSSGIPTIPFLTQPANGQRFNLYPPHERDPQTPSGPEKLELRYGLDSWMKSSRIDFKKRNADGTCASAIEVSSTQATPASCADQLTCYMSITDLPLPEPPFPGGYCWEVVGIGQNGTPVSPPGQSSWRYFVGASTNRSPGAPAASLSPGTLVGDTFGAPVKFRWDAVTTAVGYRVKVWQWLAAYGTEQLGNPQVYPPGNEWLPPSTTELELTGTVANQGRYCWELLPLIEDPANPGVPAPDAFQPRVSAGSPLCYTVGPAKPKITLDNPPPTRGYNGQAVTGTVEFPYVPDEQVIANKGADWDWETTTEPWCTTLNQVFRDIVKCKRKFRVPAVEGKKAEINIKVYNGTGAAGTTPSGMPVFEVKEPVNFGKCGGSDEECCAGSKCDNAKLTCNSSNTCKGCGIEGGPCCPGTGAQQCGSLTCQANVCKACPAMSTAPGHLSPGNDVCIAPYFAWPVNARWDSVPGATSYRVGVAAYTIAPGPAGCTVHGELLNLNTFTTTTNSSGIIWTPESEYTKNAIWAWNVTAINACGQESPTSYITNVIVPPPPPPPPPSP